MVESLNPLETLLAGAILAIVLAVAVVKLFRFGSRIGVWFSELMTENRRLYWAAVGLVFWTVIVAVTAWGLSFSLFVAYAGVQLRSPTDWAGAASIGLLLASPVVAVLAGIPWLAVVMTGRVLRWRSARDWSSGEGGGEAAVPGALPRPEDPIGR